MHWRTHQRLLMKALEASARSWSEAMRRFGRISDDRLDELLIAR
jgi:hypothetical protein